MTSTKRSPIAVVGVSALFPGSLDETGFWRDLLASRDLVRDVPPTHWLREDYYDPDPAAPDKVYTTRGAFLDPVDFDALGFGVPPNIVPATDTSQLLALIVAQRVLDEAARGQFSAMNRERLSVILGVTSGQEMLASMVSRLQRPVWVKSLREAGLPESKVREVCDRIASHYVPWQENTFPGLLGNVVAGRIANRFDTGGTNCVVDAACASSFGAVAMAVNELHLGQSDLVITGGVDTLNDIFMYTCFSKTFALSRTGDCRPFSDQADGTLLGEGLAMFALKRLEDAERDGDRIYALLRGVGSSSDGRAKSVYAPRPEGQAKALERAYAEAGYGPDSVELVEAHGTGTKAGDVAEFEGLSLAFDASGRSERQWCALGSVKSQIGHTKAAAGAAGLFKIVMSLLDGALPPTLKIARPNPKLALEKSPFYLNTVTRPWVRGAGHPRRAGVSSFGFGGSNFHLTMEEYRGPAPRALRKRVAPAELVVFGAETPAALQAALGAVEVGGPGFLAWFARHTQESVSKQAPVRLGLVATDEADLKAKLTAASAALARAPQGPLSLPGVHYSCKPREGGLAFLFPGQGSQYVGMGADLALTWREALGAWDLASDLVAEGAEHLEHVVFPRPAFEEAAPKEQAARLKRTEWAQPALGAASLAQLRLLERLGLRPDCTAGHSFGEVVALHAAGAFDAEALLRIARRRGELMAEAAARTPGAMTAALAPLAEVRAAIADLSGVEVANHNGPKQAVLSGSLEAIERAEGALRQRGLRFERLAVATAFHSPLVAGSAQPFEAFLADQPLAAPRLPVYSNSEAAPYPSELPALRTLLSSQLARPVRFVEQIEAMYAAGVRTFVEVGAGSVLTNLVQQILGGGARAFVAINLDAKGKHGVAAFHEGLARLWAAGHALDFAALWAEFQPAPDPRQAKKPAVRLSICGANYGKPYPPPEGAAKLPPPNPELPVAAPSPAAAKPAAAVAAPGPTPAPAPMAAARAAPVASFAWLDAYQVAQQQTLEAHTTWQRAMTETHTAFLRSMERSLEAITVAAGGIALAPGMPAPEAPVPTALPASPAAAAPSALPAQPVASPPAAATAQAPEPAPSAASSAPDVKQLLLAIVSEKTGYPAEMLSTELNLEGDLGIDSIKRVEILSALSERAPHLPELEPAKMASLRTLGAILQLLEQSTARAPARTSGTAAGSPSPAPQAERPSLDLKATLLAIVAEKTGYPAEMLSTELNLEGDLGIDSIKRVEILSALQERVPGLPELDPAKMGSMRTLGAILGALDQAPVPPTAGSPRAEAPRAPAPRAAPAQDLKAALLAIVAEKTGYPAEMLSTELNLEGDLGIDSIKRVEILSALGERVPNLPELDPAKMATLRTLGAILAHLDGTPGAAPAATAAVAPQPQQAATAAPASAPDRYVVEAVEAPAPGLGLHGLAQARRIAITDDGAGVAEALCTLLRARGLPAERVTAIPGDADALLFLGGLAETPTPEAADAVVRLAFQAARSVASRFGEHGGLFVTVQDTGGDFGLGGSERAWLAGIAGIAKTAALEWPKASVKAIDLQRGDRGAAALADALLAELLEGGSAREVGLGSDGRRRELRATPHALDGEAAPLEEDAVVLATGGGRGVTAACLVALARRARARFVLLGRTPLEDEPAFLHGVEGDAALKRALLEEARTKGETLTPPELARRTRAVLAAREVRATVEALESAGSEARYLAVDTRRGAAVEAALAEVRRAWGPIRALVHGAGVLADKRIADKTDEAFDTVYDTKVAGLRTLLEATREDPLQRILLFSSVAARLGNPGQCDYAAANEVLNKVAAAEARRRGASCVVKALGWGPWDGGMVDAGLRAHFTAMGTALIPLGAGAAAFAAEALSSGPCEVLLGAPLVAPPASDLSCFDVAVSRDTHPHLADHRIDGVPVLPFVQVIEWFVRAAKATNPTLALGACRDVRVLRGLRLERFEDACQWLTVACRRSADGELALELKGPDGTVHYAGRVELAPQPPASEGPSAPPADLERFARPIYGTELFHGPGFQVVREVEGVSAEGLVGTLVGTRERGWPGRWLTDAAALDGGLQLALLWTGHVTGGRSLPTSIGSLRSYPTAEVAGPIRCILRGRLAGEARTTSDIDFVGSDGAVLCELRGVEAHRRPEPSVRSAGPNRGRGA